MVWGVGMGSCKCSAYRGQRKASDHLKTEYSGLLATHPLWLLVTELETSARVETPPNQ